jgi:excinuclease ABC subunit C
MEEVVYRRYKRMLEEKSSLPQLIIIDGGKGQLSSAMKSIDSLGLRNTVTVIGIAKKLEEIYWPDDPVPLHINKKSESLKLIQHLRNEAHRFGINFHRDKRSASMIHTELMDIKGVGEVSIQKLLSHFGSVKRIREASQEEIESVVNKTIATKVIDHFAQSKND